MGEWEGAAAGGGVGERWTGSSDTAEPCGGTAWIPRRSGESNRLGVDPSAAALTLLVTGGGVRPALLGGGLIVLRSVRRVDGGSQQVDGRKPLR